MCIETISQEVQERFEDVAERGRRFLAWVERDDPDHLLAVMEGIQVAAADLCPTLQAAAISMFISTFPGYEEKPHEQ